MTYTLGTMGSSTGPRALKILIAITCAVSLGAGLLDRLFTSYLGIYGPQQIFSLSWWGILHLMIWQPVTYLFVQNAYGGLSIFFFIELFFLMYLLWMAGSMVIDMVESKPFIRMYLGTGAFAAVAALITMVLSNSYAPYAGAGPSVYAVLAVWSMLCPELELMLFGSFQVKIKWLVVGLLGISALLNLSNGNFVEIAAYLAGAFAGYAYGVTAWQLRSPFPAFAGLDSALQRVAGMVHKRRQRTKEMMETVYRNVKVFDIKTGEAVMDDDDFMDAMLTKISLYGEKSLSRKERSRMKKISEKKAKRQ